MKEEGEGGSFERAVQCFRKNFQLNTVKKEGKKDKITVDAALKAPFC